MRSKAVRGGAKGAASAAPPASSLAAGFPTPYEASFAGLDVAMVFRDVRLQTFRGQDNPWPFDEDCECTPEKMSDAGFYLIGNSREPDLVRCYWCRKEMDGWEPSDDPMAEHRRNKDCPFVKLGKECHKLTVEDMLKLETGRGICLTKKLMEKKKLELSEEVEDARKIVESMGKRVNKGSNRAKRAKKK